ncbi:MAG TPA: transcriptional regulator [Geobacteraceae bacterium]|nr:transcriptional regulator [Geobacteraceae bacterium]
MNKVTPVSGCVLDAILHQPIRTRIVAYLAGREEATFMELKRVLEISDGNLESHLKKLISADYISTRKDTGNRRQQTLYILTETGREALKTYLSSLQELLGVRLTEEKKVSDQPLGGIFYNAELGWK